jgi:uncharacterized membrane protein
VHLDGILNTLFHLGFSEELVVIMDGILNTLFHLGFSEELVVIMVSALPIVELRGAIPLAINLFDFPWYRALLLAIAGNLIPVPFLLSFFEAISRRLTKIGIFKRWLLWLEERTRRRGKIVERYKRIGLALFVAIPLPVTGAWTGSLAATIFRIKFKHALLSIFIGICIAGAIVTSLCLLAKQGL